MKSCEQGLVLSGAWDVEAGTLCLEADKIASSPHDGWEAGRTLKVDGIAACRIHDQEPWLPCNILCEEEPW